MVLDQAIATAAQEWGSRKLIVRQRPKTPEKHGWGTSGKVRRKSTEPMCPRVAEWRRGDLTGMASREGVRAKAGRYCSPPPWATAWNNPSRMPKRRPDSCGSMETGWLPEICSAEYDDAGWAVIIRKPRAVYHRTDRAQDFPNDGGSNWPLRCLSVRYLPWLRINGWNQLSWFDIHAGYFWNLAHL